MNIILTKENENSIGVYSIRNIINNKIYIGSTISGFKRRLSEHLYLLNKNVHHSNHLQKAFNKFGTKSFEFSIIEICLKENIICREQYWIDEYQCFKKDKGYNILPKAYNSSGFKHTEESLILIGEMSKRRGAHPNSINAMRLANVGRKRSEEHKKTIADISRTSVIQLDLEGRFIKEWESLKSAIQELGLDKSYSGISACCRKKCKSAAGFLWVYKKDYNSDINYFYTNDRGKHNSKTVYQYSLDNNFMKEWDSGNKAGKELNIKAQSIYNCISGLYKTAGGFKWSSIKT